MLIEKNFQEGDTISAKCVNGDELVGRLEKINDDIITVKKPMMCLMTQKGVGLVPFMVSLNPDSSVDVTRSHIISIAKTHKPIADHYIELTTGLKLN